MLLDLWLIRPRAVKASYVLHWWWKRKELGPKEGLEKERQTTEQNGCADGIRAPQNKNIWWEIAHQK